MLTVKIPNAYGVIIYYCQDVVLDPKGMLVLKRATDGAGKDIGDTLIYGPVNVVVHRRGDK